MGYIHRADGAEKVKRWQVAVGIVVFILIGVSK
jgi:hypothetical protein